ncbi:MAG: hypothetical protein WAL34_04120 [Acidobacteriaceae bacterium]
MLIIPVYNGTRIRIGDRVHFRPMTPGELLNLGLRFIEAAREGAFNDEAKMLEKQKP